VTDAIMPIVTSDALLRTLYGLAMLLILWKGDARLRWAVAFSLIVLLLADQISASLLKPWIGRLRPCQVLEGVHLLVGCGGGKSMPSSHAANALAQATFFALLYPRYRSYLFCFAAVVAISRVFVGVHYPGDVLAGALVGAVIGLAVALTYKEFMGWKYSDASQTGGDHAGAA
jgi:undecaprenyl-diphosphatase